MIVYYKRDPENPDIFLLRCTKEYLNLFVSAHKEKLGIDVELKEDKTEEPLSLCECGGGFFITDQFDYQCNKCNKIRSFEDLCK